MTLFILSISLALVGSFLCSLSEAVVLSLTPGEVAKLRERYPRVGQTWQTFKKAVDRPIIVILIINTVAHTIGATVAGAEFDKLSDGEGLWWFSLSFTLSILFFTEILPKTLGVEYRKRLALFLALPLEYLIWFFSPLVWLAGLISRPFSRKEKTAMALEELRSLAAYARLSQEIGPYQEKLITEASRLSEKTASQIMVPASDIVYFEKEKDIDLLLQQARQEPHTRFPVIKEKDLNQIEGYVNFKDLLFASQKPKEKIKLSAMIRPIQFIHPHTPLSRLLRSLVEDRVHIAIVRKKSGETLGLLTLEDVLEEFLGEIEDEFDRLPKMTQQLSGGIWMMGGGVSLKILRNKLKIKEESDAENLNEWIQKTLQRQAKVGDRLQLENYQIVVRRLRRGKVFEAMVLPAKSYYPLPFVGD